MAVHGLVIAVENYPKSSGLAGQLPGTNQAAEAFCEWLARNKGVYPKGDPRYDARRFFCCADEGVPFGTHGSQRQDIVQAIAELASAARDNCEELYCYLAGHGFCYPRDELVQEDIFVASDFTTLATGGGACLKLAEIISLLASALGPGTHYYFFDACRTEIPFGAVRPVDTGLALPRSQLGFAGNAVLFSVEQGLAARTDSGFSKHLVDGLNGKGRAKGWYNDELYVKFDLLWKYVEAQSRRRLSQRIGESEGLILKIDPVPEMNCTLRVQNAGSADTFHYRVYKRTLTVQQGTFQGAAHTFQIKEPGLYEIEVLEGAVRLPRVQPPATEPVDLFDPAEVVFQKVPAGLEALAAGALRTSRDGTVTIRAAHKASVQIRGMGGEFNFDGGEASITTSLPPGDYQVTLRELGDVVASSTLNVDPGTSLDFNPVTLSMTPVHEAILQQLSQPGAHEVWFSESLHGPTLDRDLGLWLAYLGASRIVRPTADFAKLSKVALAADFSATPTGQSGIYFLAALRDRPPKHAVTIGPEAKWIEMMEVPGVPGLCEFSAPVAPGPVLVSFQSSGSPPLTLASHALPDRITLLTLTTSEGPMPLRLYQFMLPIWSLQHPSPVGAGDKKDVMSPLQRVRFVAHLQRLFTQQHSVKKAFGDPEVNQDLAGHQAYRDLMDGKWLDPVGMLIAARDLLRQGVLDPNQPDSRWREAMPRIVANLRQHFPGIADNEALARAVGLPAEFPEAAPLLADSLMEYDPQMQERFLPFTNALRIFGTPWVAWANAVAPYFQPGSETAIGSVGAQK